MPTPDRSRRFISPHPPASIVCSEDENDDDSEGARREGLEGQREQGVGGGGSGRDQGGRFFVLQYSDPAWCVCLELLSGCSVAYTQL